MRKTSFHLLRVGLAITFLWIGVLIFKDPEAWGGYVAPWALGLLPLPLAQAMMGTAMLDIAIGALLLVDILTSLAALVGAIHLIVVLAVSGITDITVRDIGLLAGVLALAIDSVPKRVIRKLPFLKTLIPETNEGRTPETT
jgi:uncharacterized membrane protein